MDDLKTIYFLNNRVQLLQPKNGFRPGLDSVMLAAACPAQSGERVLDLGCGVGSAGFCMLERVPGTTLTGIDIQNDHIGLADKNAALNKMEDRTTFKTACISGYQDTSFDHVICNPPYLEDGKHMRSPDESKALAHGHDNTDVEDWVNAAFRCVKSKGSLTMIHRADQVDEIIKALGKRFGAVEIIPLWPKHNIPAKRTIIRASKNRRSPAIIHPGLTLHQEDGKYTKEAENILREASALFKPPFFPANKPQRNPERCGPDSLYYDRAA